MSAPSPVAKLAALEAAVTLVAQGGTAQPRERELLAAQLRAAVADLRWIYGHRAELAAFHATLKAQGTAA